MTSEHSTQNNAGKPYLVRPCWNCDSLSVSFVAGLVRNFGALTLFLVPRPRIPDHDRQGPAVPGTFPYWKYVLITLISESGQGNKPLNHTLTTHYLSLISLCRKRTTIYVHRNDRRNSTSKIKKTNKHHTRTAKILSNETFPTQKTQSERKMENHEIVTT